MASDTGKAFITWSIVSVFLVAFVIVIGYDLFRKHRGSRIKEWCGGLARRWGPTFKTLGQLVWHLLCWPVRKISHCGSSASRPVDVEAAAPSSKYTGIGAANRGSQPQSNGTNSSTTNNDSNNSDSNNNNNNNNNDSNSNNDGISHPVQARLPVKAVADPNSSKIPDPSPNTSITTPHRALLGNNARLSPRANFINPFARGSIIVAGPSNAADAAASSSSACPPSLPEFKFSDRDRDDISSVVAGPSKEPAAGGSQPMGSTVLGGEDWEEVSLGTR